MSFIFIRACLRGLFMFVGFIRGFGYAEITYKCEWRFFLFLDPGWSSKCQGQGKNLKADSSQSFYQN